MIVYELLVLQKYALLFLIGKAFFQLELVSFLKHMSRKQKSRRSRKKLQKSCTKGIDGRRLDIKIKKKKKKKAYHIGNSQQS